MRVRISSGVHIDSGNDDEPAPLSPQAPLPPSSRYVSGRLPAQTACSTAAAVLPRALSPGPRSSPACLAPPRPPCLAPQAAPASVGAGGAGRVDRRPPRPPALHLPVPRPPLVHPVCAPRRLCRAASPGLCTDGGLLLLLTEGAAQRVLRPRAPQPAGRLPPAPPLAGQPLPGADLRHRRRVADRIQGCARPAAPRRAHARQFTTVPMSSLPP